VCRRLIAKYPVLKDTVGIPFVSVYNYGVALYYCKIAGLMEGGNKEEDEKPVEAKRRRLTKRQKVLTIKNL